MLLYWFRQKISLLSRLNINSWMFRDKPIIEPPTVSLASLGWSIFNVDMDDIQIWLISTPKVSKYGPESPPVPKLRPKLPSIIPTLPCDHPVSPDPPRFTVLGLKMNIGNLYILAYFRTRKDKIKLRDLSKISRTFLSWRWRVPDIWCQRTNPWKPWRCSSVSSMAEFIRRIYLKKKICLTSAVDIFIEFHFVTSVNIKISVRHIAYLWNTQRIFFLMSKGERLNGVNVKSVIGRGVRELKCQGGHHPILSPTTFTVR